MAAPQNNENNRNTLIFVACAMVILIAYQFLVLGPAAKRREAEQRARAAAAALNPAAAGAPGSSVFVSRAQAIAQSPRVAIDTPALQGSLALRGGRLDDLYLKDYRETLAKDSPPVELFRPEGAKQAYFAVTGWAGAPGAPDAHTLWGQAGGGALSPDHPVTLTYDNGQGLAFTRTVAVDSRYMFTVTDAVANNGAAPVKVAPFASVQRQGKPQLSQSLIIHEGAVGALNDTLKLIAFKDWKKTGDFAQDSIGGWLGVTDKYWLAAVIPGQRELVKGGFRVSGADGVDVYEAEFTGPARLLAPGSQTTQTTRVFAGAKKVAVLQDYQHALGIPHFDDAVDWGHLWFLTRPVFWLLEQFHRITGNFGLSILMLTVVVKAAFFPLANKSYESVSKMKKIAPEVEAIKKRFDKDPAAQQKATMELYGREKINPVTGCLPQLVQVPVFYALYKTLFVTIEMRHAPFFGWIRDLSAPDPTSFVNLFGLLPFNPATVPAIGGVLDGPLHIGLWPILYGVTTWLNTAMNPQPTQDPTQKLIFQLFPLVFVFTMSHFVVGVVIYYAWSGALSALQQYVIMRRYKVQTPIDDIIVRFRRRPAVAIK